MPKYIEPVKDSFELPTSWSSAIIGLPNEDAGKLMKAVFAYNYEGQVRETFLDGDVYHLFLLMKPFFDGEIVCAGNVSKEE